jgi:predicted Zn finger-like uncharacterized protein
MPDLAADFNCPRCATAYKVVHAEAEDAAGDDAVPCLQCGAPLQGREGRFLLKYFLGVGRQRRAARPVVVPSSSH